MYGSAALALAGASSASDDCCGSEDPYTCGPGSRDPEAPGEGRGEGISCRVRPAVPALLSEFNEELNRSPPLPELTVM